MKEFIQSDKDDDYIPLISAITLKKKKRMLFLQVEFNNVKIDALVDSGAYINAIREKDDEKIKQNADHCIINKAPPPPFKVQYANANWNNLLRLIPCGSKSGTTLLKKCSS